MVYFKVSQNINIKTTDGSLVKYHKAPPGVSSDDFIYCSTYNDFLDLKSVFSRVDKKYQIKVLLEERILSSHIMPIELGITNKFEYQTLKKIDYRMKKNLYVEKSLEHKIKEVSFSEDGFDFYEQIKHCIKLDISLAIIGGVGRNIGEIISSCSALRILHEELKNKFPSVKLDIYLESSENKYYSRDKELLLTQGFIHKIEPLSLSLKKLLSYDFIIDTSLLNKRTYFSHMPYVDAYLYKFGIDYEKVNKLRKSTFIDRISASLHKNLIKKIKDLKKVGKLLLFHPYSANEDRSIPKEFAIKYMKKLIRTADDYSIVSALNIVELHDDRYVNLANMSKSLSEFIYIISQADKIITVDTSTYHIADAFFVPTLVLFTDDKANIRTKYYQQTKTIEIEDKTKNYSTFTFENPSLELYKHQAWKDLKISKVMKLLETI